MLDRPTFRQVLKCAKNMRPLDKREMTALVSDDPYEVAFSVLEHGMPAWAALHGDVPAYAFGLFIDPSNEQWAVWGFGTSYFPKVAVDVSKTIKRVLIPLVRNAGVKRIEVLSLAEKTDAHRWLKWFGWIEEDVITDFRCTGETFKLFAWS